MTEMQWPPWHLAGEPVGLVKYVNPAAVKRYLRLPGPSDADPLRRTEAVYDAIAEVGIGYAFESRSSSPDWQVIRTPAEILQAPRHATCLDLAVTFAAACIVAGLRPIVMVLDPGRGNSPAHAVVMVWLGTASDHYPLADHREWWTELPASLSDLVWTDLAGPPRPFIVVDPVAAAVAPPGLSGPPYGLGFAAAMAQGAAYVERDAACRLRLAIDVAKLWSPGISMAHPGEAPHPGPPREPPGNWVFGNDRGREHFARYASGHRYLSWDADLYTGRRRALDRIISHCTSERDPHVPLLLTGQPGSGKSTVLARAVGELSGQFSVGVAVYARDAGVTDIVHGVAEACGLPPTNEANLASQIAARSLQPFFIAVDALDEMRTHRDRNESATLLRELATIPGVRVAVSTRPLVADRGLMNDAWRRSDVIRQLLRHRPNEDAVINLDDDQFFSVDDLTSLVEKVLQGEGFESVVPAAAWQEYRADTALRSEVSAAICRRADRNYLAAVMTASILARDDHPPPIRNGVVDENSLPDGMGEVLDKLLDQLSDRHRTRIKGLLVALAYGKGSGLTDVRWLDFAHALGWSSLEQSDIDELRETAGADYLLEDVLKDGRALTGLFHRALADHLREGRDARQDESALCTVLLRDAVNTEWADGYVRRFLPAHVLAAGRSAEFLEIPEFVACCYPSSVWPVAVTIQATGPADPASVLRLALPQLSDDLSANASALELVARVQGAEELAERLKALQPGRLAETLCVEAVPSQVPKSAFLHHTGSVRGVCAFQGKEGPLVVTVSADATALVWDPFDPLVPPLMEFDRHTAAINGVTALMWNGQPMVITVSSDGTARIWDPTDPRRPAVASFGQHEGAVYASSALPRPGGGAPLVVTTSADRTARVWDADDPLCVQVAVFDKHDGPVNSAAVLPWPERDTQVVITTSDDGTARVWDPYHPSAPELARFEGHEDWVGGIAVLPWQQDHKPMVATTSGDGSVRIWDPRSGDCLHVYRGHGGRVRDVTLLWLADGWPVCASSSDDGTVHMWRADPDGLVVLGVYDAHTGAVQSAALVPSAEDGQDLIVSVCSDHHAHVWDPRLLAEHRARGGHTGRVRSAVLLPKRGDQDSVLITASNDSTVRIWQVAQGVANQVNMFGAHRDWVRYLDLLPWPGRSNPVVVSGSGDATIRIWDPLHLDQGQLAHFNTHIGPVRTVRAVELPGYSVPLLLSCGADRTVQLFNPYALVDESVATLHHPDIVRSAVAFPGGEAGFLIAAAVDMDIYLWDIAVDLANPVHVWRGHTEWVRDLAVVKVGDQTRLCSVANDMTMRIWNPSDRDGSVEVVRGHTDWIWSVSTADISGAVATASADGTVRLWSIGEFGVAAVGKLPIVATALSVRFCGEEMIVTTNRGFVIYRVNWPDHTNAPHHLPVLRRVAPHQFGEGSGGTGRSSDRGE